MAEPEKVSVEYKSGPFVCKLEFSTNDIVGLQTMLANMESVEKVAFTSSIDGNGVTVTTLNVTLKAAIVAGVFRMGLERKALDWVARIDPSTASTEKGH